MAKKDMPQILLPHSGLQMRYCPALAKEVGPMESVMLLQVEWWLHHSDKVIFEDGEWWLKEGMRGIALALGMSPSTAYDLLKKLEKRSLIKVKDAPKGARIPITLNWESVRNLNSLDVRFEGKVSETRKEVSETRIHKEEESLDSKESLLLQEIEKLKAEIQALKTEKKKASDLPADWNDVLGHLNGLWPNKAGVSARGLKNILKDYPGYWPRIKSILTDLHREGGDRINVPGAIAYQRVEQMAINAQFGGQPRGGEQTQSPKPQESKPVPAVDFKINRDALKGLGGGR